MSVTITENSFYSIKLRINFSEFFNLINSNIIYEYIRKNDTIICFVKILGGIKMTSNLLKNTRRINKTLQANAATTVSFNQLTNVLGDVLDSNVYVVRVKGKVLGYSLVNPEDSSIVLDEENNSPMFPVEYAESLLTINDTRENMSQEETMRLFPQEKDRLDKFTVIIPIWGSAQRLGTLILSRYDRPYTDDDIVVAEYSATVIGLEILRSISEEMEEEMRKKAVVQMAIGTLSYSELEAIEHIFKELGGNEGLLVASKIADKVGITRSVIVNALRKFESAGVIESRSLGMKGTHIRILNDKLLDELKKSRTFTY